MKPKVRTCLTISGQAEEAARFYVSLLPNSHIGDMLRLDPAAPPILVEFTLAGTPYQIMNMGPQSTLNDATSISVLTADQAETDRLWNALLADGGQESRCGWLADRFGLCWQIVPEVLPRFLGDKDRVAAGRAMQAMLGMAKIDIAAIEAAFNAR